MVAPMFSGEEAEDEELEGQQEEGDRGDSLELLQELVEDIGSRDVENESGGDPDLVFDLDRRLPLRHATSTLHYRNLSRKCEDPRGIRGSGGGPVHRHTTRL
jgi:hypothetical protein